MRRPNRNKKMPMHQSLLRHPLFDKRCCKACVDTGLLDWTVKTSSLGDVPIYCKS